MDNKKLSLALGYMFNQSKTKSGGLFEYEVTTDMPSFGASLLKVKCLLF